MTMTRILNMAMKDIKLIFRDRMSLFFICGFPVLMGLFFGMVMGGATSGKGSGKIRVAVVDEDQSDMSRAFIASLRKNDNLDLQDAARVEAAESVRKGRRVGMIALPKGFGEQAGMFWGEPPKIELGLDPSRGAESAMLQGFIMQGIGDLVGQRFQNPQQFLPAIQNAREMAEQEDMSTANRLLMGGFFDSLESMIANADQLNLSTEGQFGTEAEGGMQFADVQRIDLSRQIDPDSPAAQAKKLKSGWEISFPQAMLWGVLSCVTGFAISIARERTQGTFTRLQVAPIKTSDILLGKSTACFLTSLAVMLAMVCLGFAVNVWPNSFPKLLAACICIAISFTGIMMIVSVFGKTEQSVSGAGTAVIMVLAMIGGCMIPAMFLPGFLQTVSVISPVRWGIMALEGAIWRDFSWMEMAPALGVLLGFGVVCFFVGNTVLKAQVAK